MTGAYRVGIFVLVGVGGFLVQLGVLVALTGSGCALVPATAVAVEAAILHNFWWHERLTWRDRACHTTKGHRFVRFHAAAGGVSLAGTVTLTYCISLGGISPAVANTAAVVTMSVANFAAADRWVFGVRRQVEGHDRLEALSLD